MKELPIACSLDAAGLGDRVDRWRALADRALITAERTDEGAIQRYRNQAGVEAELRDLIALEAECCPFLDFELAERDGEVELAIAGPPDAGEMLDVFSARSSAPGGRSSRPGSAAAPGRG